MESRNEILRQVYGRNFKKNSRKAVKTIIHELTAQCVDEEVIDNVVIHLETLISALEASKTIEIDVMSKIHLKVA